MLRVVIDAIRSRHKFLGGRKIFAGVRVSLKTGKVAAADLESQPVPFPKNVAGRPQVKSEFVGLTWLQQQRLFLGIAVTRPDNPLGQVLCESVGPHIH